MNNDRHRQVIEDFPDAFAFNRMIIDSDDNPVDFVFLEVNTAFEKMTGYKKDEVVGKRSSAAFPEFLEDSLLEAIGRSALYGEVVRCEHYLTSLGRWYELTLYSDKPGFFVITFKDITDRIARQGLLDANFQREMLNTAVIWINMLDKEGNVTFWNKAAEQISGYTAEEVLGHARIWEWLYPDSDYRAEITKKVKDIMQKGEQVENFETRIIRKDGLYRTISWHSNNLVGEDGKVIGSIALGADITERKQIEEELKESEQKYRQLFEASPISLWEQDFSAVKRRVDEMKNQGITDLRSFLLERPELVEELAGLVQVVDVNQATLSLYNARSKEDFYSGITKVFAEESYEDFIEAPLAIAERRTDLVLERVHVTFEGEPLRVQLYWSVAPGYEDTYSRVLVSIVDVTSQKRIEELLKHQLQFEKMVSDISSYLVALPSEQVNKGIYYVLERIGRFFQIDRSYFFRFSDDNKTMSQTHEWCAEGVEPQMENTQNVPVDSLPWWAEKIKTMDHVHIPDVDRLPPEAEAEKEEFRSQNILSLLCVPIVKEGTLFGFIGFDAVKEKRTWSEEHIVLLKVVAELISNVFAKHLAEEKLRYLSFHDSLTGLYNRYYLEEEMNRLDTERQLPISVIMVDLNGLKLVNDTYGHRLGDEMLKKAAEILCQSCRKEDIIARWGGDEFVIFLPQTGLEASKTICKRISEKCRKEYVQDVPISLAIGIAVKEDKGKSLIEFLRTAEDEMYKQKLSESRSARSAVLNALLKTLEPKSFETGAHVQRMQNVALKIGEKLRLADSELSRLNLLITLHDIGKINISEEILTKKESLTTEEWEIMKKHPEIGYRITRATEEFSHVADDILAHHERWDGTGYPQGLKSKEIPLLARIAAIADAYEVMANGRPYREPLTKSEIIAEFRECAGKQFDPELVEIFLDIFKEESF